MPNVNNLGRRHSPDQRDHNYLLTDHLPLVVTEQIPSKKLWTISKQHLDQGNTGTCVGHGCRNFLRCAPIQTVAKHPSEFDIYRSAVLLDTFTDNDDEANLPDGDPGMDSGTTVRAGMKALAKSGNLISYAWAFSLEPTLQWLLTKGPVVVGVNWYDSMFTPDSSGMVHISPGAQVAGGHCFCIRGYDRQLRRSRCVQSWGNGWGLKGDFYLSDHDLDRLISENGEVATAIQKN